MKTKTITRILNDHCVANRVENGRVLADSMIAHEETTWVDVTSWSRVELLAWLGYDVEDAD